MRVETHELFEQFQWALAQAPEASVVDSLTESPRLGDFLNALDPHMSLDWSGASFQGLPRLREKVRERTGVAHACGLDDVLITAGTAEANFLAITQLVQPGDEMIVDVPGWPQPLVLGKAIGATIRHLPRDEANGWAPDLDHLTELVTKKTRLIFLCNPNNPTGHLLDQAGLEKILDLAAAVGAYVLTDEVYRGLEWQDTQTPSAAALYERGISTGSVSKVLGLQGIRTGWLISRDPQVVRDAVVLREDTSEIMNVTGEAIADIALGDAYHPGALSRARETGRRNLDLLDEFVGQQASLSWHRPQAGLIGFCALSAGLDVDAEEFSQRLLAPPYRTFVMPGSAYGHPHHLRLGAGGSTARLQDGLDRLARFMATLD